VREGVTATGIAGVELVRDSNASRRSPVLYEPMILFLAQGRKCAYLGDERLTYDPDHYLALSVPVPVECEVTASADEPLLAVKIGVEPALLAEILVSLDAAMPASERVPRGMHASPLPVEMRGAVIRLLEALQTPNDTRILGQQIVREIVYRVLQDEPGSGLRALAARNNQFLRIAKVLEHLHADHAGTTSNEALAKLAGMSVSTFHHNFKLVTAMSPLQYGKSVRLHRARMLMVHSGHTASTAASAVGYESASQFGREFKRYFGVSPGAEAASVRARLTAAGEGN
jgi:AraC-like DNA-binding protein